MKTGMLWFDNGEDRDLEARLQRAIKHYLQKYGTVPNLCYVHPSMLVGKQKQIAGIELLASNTVLPHHFWLGEDHQQEQRPAA